MLTTLKKPLNALENPVYPDIRGKPPRFYQTRKHWVVDAPKVMAQVEFQPDYLDYVVLPQQRDYNERIYGKSSSRDVVNKAFRPPLITMEDTMPLNRIPRGAVIPRNNPGTTSDFHLMPRDTELLTEFTNAVDKQHFTTDRVKHGYNPVSIFYKPLDLREGGIGGVVPDLKLKLKRPQTSVNTNKTSFKSSVMDEPISYSNISISKLLPEDKVHRISVTSGVNAPYKQRSFISNLEGEDYPELADPERTSFVSYIAPSSMKIENFNAIGEDYEGIELENKRPNFSYNTNKTLKNIGTSENPDYELQEKTGPGYVNSSQTSSARFMPEFDLPELEKKTSHLEKRIRKNANIGVVQNLEGDRNLEEKIKAGSVTTRRNAKIGKPLENTNYDFEEKTVLKKIRTNQRINAGMKQENTEYTFKQKTGPKNMKPMKSVKLDTIDRSTFGNNAINKKTEKEDTSLAIAPGKTFDYKAENNYKKPEFKQKESFQTTSNYKVKGYMPRTGIAMGEGGRGLGMNGTHKLKQRKGE